ncbi:MAG: dihydroorotase [Candidatus Eremiobacteraeota bacterium]|nr:dihydroorotase [Candidatus Eremiobacteraeota bacterium]
MAGSLLIKGGRIVDPSQPFDGIADVRIADGVVAEIGTGLSSRGEPVFDATGAIVAPGFIDMHVHLREPGFAEKETILTGTEAAVRGGFTAVACMPNTNPALDRREILDDLRALIERVAHCRVYPIGAITKARAGVEACDFGDLSAAGAVAFSDDGNTVMNARVLRDAALRALLVPGPFISHCEDEHLKGKAVMNEGAASLALRLPGSPAVAEDAIVARDLLIALDTGKPWHIAHVSTRGAVETVRLMRHRGVTATCEVTPHHLHFIDSDFAVLGSAGKVNPPLRTAEDVTALREAVMDGTIDVFASDHAPHAAWEKNEGITTAAVGFTGLEIAIGAYAAAVPDLPLERFVMLASTNPARILGIPGGTLAPGNPGDVTIFADRPWTVDAQGFASKGHCTPFDGLELPRQCIATVVGGEVLYRSDRNA